MPRAVHGQGTCHQAGIGIDRAAGNPKFPGAEHVTTVEVDRQADDSAKTNWALHVFTREGGNMERIQFAISTTRKRLRHRYYLRPDG